MIKTSLFLRLTYEYADGWSSLDKERCLGQITVTPRRQVHAGDRWGDGGTFIQHVRVPRNLRGARASVIATALANTMGGTSCRHEHDCCGCTIRMVTVKKVGPRDFVARSQIRLNH
jgi:hypothetical protein